MTTRSDWLPRGLAGHWMAQEQNQEARGPNQKYLYLIHTLAPATGTGISNLQQECLMGVRPHQTNTAHFTECSEGLLDTLQMSHRNIQNHR